MSEKVYESASNTVSRLVSALNLAMSYDDATPASPEGMYGFSAIIETEKIKLESQYVDFEFDIPFDDDTVPNESEITIYNLSNETANNFKQGNTLTITAGYGTDTGIVLKGKISAVKTKHSGVDKITTVYVLDNADYRDSDLAEQTFAENTNASYILKTLLEKLDLPIAVFETQRDHTYTKETTVSGSITEAIKTYADVCGVSVYVCKQQIYCRPIWLGDNIHYTISAATGMIDNPEPFEEENTNEEYKDTVTGYNITMLFQHRMTTAAIVNVSSKDYNGTYRVCSGTHSFDGLSATTEIKCIENITTEIVKTDEDSNSSSTSKSNYAKKALSWALEIAADDENHGYDQTNRWGPDYDCSSFVTAAYVNAGLDFGLSDEDLKGTYTGDMYEKFTAAGFEDVTSRINKSDGSGCIEGDVLINEAHHAAMYAGNGNIVQASINENGAVTGGQTGDQTGKEIYVRDYYNKPWDYVLRYPAPVGTAVSVNIRRNIMFTSSNTNSQEYLILHTSCCPGFSAERVAETVDGNGCSIHGVIDEDGVLQTAEWTTKCAHIYDPGNSISIGFEQCEHSKIKWLGANSTSVTWDSAYDAEIKAFHDTLYNNAVALFAYLANEFDIPTDHILSHKEANRISPKSNHADPEEMWESFVKRWGDSKYTMDSFRSAVDAARNSLADEDDSNYGEWITGWQASTYGNKGDNDTGLCWGGQIRFANASGNNITSDPIIDGNHVAVPTYCIKALPTKYNSKLAQKYYPGFSNVYGDILELRLPDTKTTCYAVVADCGSMGPENSANQTCALDLAPNTQKALLGKYQETKVYIEFRKVGNISSWDGSQSQIEEAVGKGL